MSRVFFLLSCYGLYLRVWLSQLQEKLWNLVRATKYRTLKKGLFNPSTLLFLYYPNAIAESQLYPFHVYRKKLLQSFALELKACPVDEWSQRATEESWQPKIIIIQSHFHTNHQSLATVCSQLKSHYPKAKIVFFDWFAASDLRLASTVEPFIELYVKKTVFVDVDQYRTRYFGDTNLMDYYGHLYQCQHEMQQYDVPQGIGKKLTTGIGFISAPYLHSLFSRAERPKNQRPIDINARFATRGSDWYSAMRSVALNKAIGLSADYAVAHGSLPRAQYLRELGQSKVTFSPFGYGEICWRDYEAMALGSLLIKPDMSHLEVNPDIFVPYETYIPLAWDLSDFDEKVIHYLSSPAERLQITKNAFEVGHQFVRQGKFIDHVKDLI
tara:strand:- start:91 stop:1239 length:1149 start_codon:yes stop_codon:yes gene_type:complete